MYNGTIRTKTDYKINYNNKAQMLEIEQTEINGVITEKYVIKTKTFENDPNIKVRDFDIKNLMAIGVFDTLQPTKLSTPFEKVAANADTANNVIQEIDFINQLENGQQTNNKNS